MEANNGAIAPHSSAWHRGKQQNGSTITVLPLVKARYVSFFLSWSRKGGKGKSNGYTQTLPHESKDYDRKRTCEQ
eukprot:5248615-Ditylum_brightwellii.AAC.1